MDMKEQHAQDQEVFEKLISLKGHETPPPGYGDLLASRIISRLRSTKSHIAIPFCGAFSETCPFGQRFPLSTVC